MAIYHEDIVTVELSSGSIHRSFLNHSIGSGDAEANRFGVRVMRNGEDVDLTGVSCFGYFRNAEGTNIALTSEGTVSGNVAYVTLPQACYNVEGQFALSIKLIGGGVTGTMRIVDGVVDNTNTGSAVAPTEDVPTYTEILAVYDQMLEAVEDYAETVEEQNEKISDLETETNEKISDLETETNEKISDLKSAITTDTKTITKSATVAGYVNYTDGSIEAISSYRTFGRVEIPTGVKRIMFPDVLFNYAGVAGWATYSSGEGSATQAFLRGGQTSYIDVTENDVYFAVSTNSDSNVNISVVYVYELESLARHFDNCITENSINATINIYIDIRTGSYESISNNQYSSIMRTRIPYGCKMIVFPDNYFNYAGVAGWATYKSGIGTSTGAFVKSGQDNYIMVDDDDAYFGVTAYNANGAPSQIKVVYCFGAGADIYASAHPLFAKRLCFCGDSVTYGYDDSASGAQLARPWTKQVAGLLYSNAYNYGVSSASLMDGQTGGGDPTPRAWVNWYPNVPDEMDIVGVMIGINDCYRDYTLGQFSDRTASTFYGALHVFWQGMLAKYPPESNKRLFAMLYPAYEGKAATWPQFVTAMVEVAQYYSIPILDLSKEMGISYHADPNYKYWALVDGIHSPHLTQYGADTVAPVIADFLSRQFAH